MPCSRPEASCEAEPQKVEVTAAIEKPKAKQPTVLLTVEDFSSIYSTIYEPDDEEARKHADWMY